MYPLYDLCTGYLVFTIIMKIYIQKLGWSKDTLISVEILINVFATLTALVFLETNKVGRQ